MSLNIAPYTRLTRICFLHDAMMPLSRAKSFDKEDVANPVVKHYNSDHGYSKSVCAQIQVCTI
jgi:hypothetical protein